jgi:hypothetical protein
MWGLGVGSLALGLVNGALVISAGIGLVAYQQILQLSPRQRKGLMQRLQQGLPLPTSPQHQALILAGVAGASTYTFTALWHSTHSLLMALLRSSRSAERSDDLWNADPIAQVEHNLGLLSHPDPLKRLVAVRRLVRLTEQGAVDGSYLAGMSVRSHLIDCFQLRLNQESDAIVRSALEDGQTLLRQAKPLSPSSSTPFSAAFTTDSALDLAELTHPLEAQPIAESSPSGSLNSFRLEDSEPAAAADSAPTEPVAATATDTPPPAAPAPTPKGRRGTVEYVEYLDI